MLHSVSQFGRDSLSPTPLCLSQAVCRLPLALSLSPSTQSHCVSLTAHSFSARSLCQTDAPHNTHPVYTTSHIHYIGYQGYLCTSLSYILDYLIARDYSSCVTYENKKTSKMLVYVKMAEFKAGVICRWWWEISLQKVWINTSKLCSVLWFVGRIIGAWCIFVAPRGSIGGLWPAGSISIPLGGILRPPQSQRVWGSNPYPVWPTLMPSPLLYLSM